MTVALVAVAVDPPATVNVPVLAPAATVAVVGTVTRAELALSDTAIPPAGAGPVRVIFPVDVVPVMIVEGVTETEESAAGTTVTLTEVVVPSAVAEIVTGVAVVTTDAVPVKVFDVAPAATVIEEGTAKTVGLLDVRVTI